MQTQEKAKELKQTTVYESVITINGNELQKMTDSELKKYMGYPFKISWKRNTWNGLRRSLTVNPDIKQEFLPNPDKFYILEKQKKEFIYPCGLNAKYANEAGLYRYWFINTTTAGIVHFQCDVNRYDIDCIHIYKYLTPELKALLDENQTANLNRIRKDMQDKHRNTPESLPDELSELIVNYIPIDCAEVFQEQYSPRELPIEEQKQEGNAHLSKRGRY